jgi:hypothetical protein
MLEKLSKDALRKLESTFDRSDSMGFGCVVGGSLAGGGGGAEVVGVWEMHRIGWACRHGLCSDGWRVRKARNAVFCDMLVVFAG